jgi:hypothetical protein
MIFIDISEKMVKVGLFNALAICTVPPSLATKTSFIHDFDKITYVLVLISK